MKILVCVSKTPDTTAKISFTPDGSAFQEAGVQYIMNPYDEWYALVRALDLQKDFGGTVTLINVGAVDTETVIRKGLAIGADDAVRVDAKPEGAYFVAQQIAAYAKTNGFDIIFTGKETIDYNGSEVGGMIAEIMDWPFVSYGSNLEMQGNIATITRDIEGGVEVIELATPFVVSAAKGMAEQRIPNMQGIMKAKMKPLQVIPAVACESPSQVIHYDLPKEKTSVKMIAPDNMDELVRLLHEEAKVI